ncbi:MAG: mobile mystery protein B [Gemmatimonadota bacterium]
MNEEDPDDATPLDPDESEGLIPGHITTREELNEWETANILDVEGWAFARKHPSLLSLSFIRDLHARMFGETWSWFGEFRRSEKNIGVPWEQIPMALRDLCDDVAYWIENGTYDLDEAAARFHHRLTQIHPFPNGNGRHARLMTDLLLRANGARRFAWGRGDLNRSGDVRDRYIRALRAADDHDYDPLLRFLGRGS